MSLEPPVRRRLALMAVLCAAGLGLAFSLDRTPAAGAEDGAYLALGKAIATGRGYRNVWLEQAPPQTKYPCGLPLLLSPVVAVFGLNFAALRALIAVFAVALLCLSEFALGEEDDGCVPWVVLLLACSRSFWQYSTWVGPEVPFAAFVSAAVFFARRYAREPDAATRNGGLTLFFFCWAYFTRTIGVCVLPGVVMSILLSGGKGRVRKAALAAAVLSAPVVIWSLVTRSGVSGSYYSEVLSNPYEGMAGFSASGIIDCIVKDVYASIFYSIPRVLTGIQFAERSWAAPLITALPLAGLLLRLRRDKSDPAAWCVAGYLGILAVYPWSRVSGARYMFPILPFLFFYAVSALVLAWRRLFPAGGTAKAALTASCLIAAAMNVLQMSRPAPERDARREAERRYYDAASWLGRAAGRSDRIFAAGTPSLYLFSGRATTGISCPYTAQSLLDAIRSSGARFAFVAESAERRVDCLSEPFSAVIRRKPGVLAEVFSNADNHVYEISRLKY